MKLLLDTHVFIWMVIDPGRISAATLAAVSNPLNHRFLSVASAWEMAIKSGTGKMQFHLPVPELIEQGLRDAVVDELPIRLPHALAVENLPRHHNDPFDRILIAQTMIESMTLVTVDKAMSAYGIPILW